MKFKDKIKRFFADKINLTMVILSVLFVILAVMPINSVWYIKFVLWILAIDMGLLGYKMYKRHKANKEVYDVIDNTTQQPNQNVFSRVTGTFQSIDKNSYLIYSICFWVLAILIIVYTVIK
ncbi:MAG: hypothetical protein E7361_01155 [Clostridiales bacterium]|nr:hypothetical protein [Clostridiales bacterium]